MPPPPLLTSIPSFSNIGTDPNVRLPPLTVLPPPPHSTSILSSSAIGADLSMGLPLQTVYPSALVPSAASRLPAYTLSTTSALPMPSNAVAMDPPPVSMHLRSQILAGADIDLASLLPSISISEPLRSFDCGPITINLKNSNSKSNCILSLAEFCIAFGRYTEIICSAFPSRRKELNYFLSIIAELAHTYGGSHFYTYYKLFSAKCTARVTQWNQCPYITFTFTFTFMHLADAFIQSDLQCIQAIHVLSLLGSS